MVRRNYIESCGARVDSVCEESGASCADLRKQRFNGRVLLIVWDISRIKFARQNDTVFYLNRVAVNGHFKGIIWFEGEACAIIDGGFLFERRNAKHSCWLAIMVENAQFLSLRPAV